MDKVIFQILVCLLCVFVISLMIFLAYYIGYDIAEGQYLDEYNIQMNKIYCVDQMQKKIDRLELKLKERGIE